MDIPGFTENQPGNFSCQIDVPQPCCLIIFGASGDLAKKKLIPSIYRLYRQKLLPEGFFVLGTGRTPLTTEQFRENMRSSTRESLSEPCDDACWNNFSSLLEYQIIDYGDPESFKKNIADFLPALLRGNAPGQGRELQVGMAINQPWQDGAGAMVADQPLKA